MLGLFKQVEVALHLGHKEPDSDPKEEDGEKVQEESNEPKEEDGDQEPEKTKQDQPAEQLMDIMQNFKKTELKKTRKGRVRGRKGLASGLLKMGKEYADKENEEEEDEEDCEDGDCAEEEEEEKGEEEEAVVARN